MKKYKVTIETSSNYVIDVLADNEEQARDKATEKFSDIKANNTEHYYQYGDSEELIGVIYDVTNTDDPFNA